MSVGWVAAGTSLVTGMMGADAAEDAAGIQAGATDRANALTQKQFEQTRSDLAPYRNYGGAATNRMMYLLGLDGGSAGGSGGAGGAGSAGSVDRDALRSELLSQFTTTTRPSIPHGWEDAWVQYAEPTTTIDEAGLEAAINQRVQAAQAAQFTPSAQPSSSDPAFGSLLKNFTGEDLESEPGYKFGLNQGMNALNSRLAAGGSYFSGGALKAGQRYAQDYAGTKFGDAFNRDSANKTRTYNFLSGGASLGQNAAAQTGNAGMNMAQQVGANTTALGNAQGAAGIAGANAWSNGIQNAVGGYQQNELMNKILAGNRGWGGGSNAMRGGYTVPTYDGAEY